MMERSLLVLACACIAVLTTLALAAWLGREAPIEVGPGEVASLEVGTRVAVEGFVEAPGAREGDGFSTLSLGDGRGGSVPVFLTFSSPGVRAGDRVQVIGEVTLHRGTPQVTVERPNDLVVLARTRSPVATVGELVGEPWRFEGTEPRVPAEVVVPPMADTGGEDWWCLLSDPGSQGVPCAVALLGQGVQGGSWTAGDVVELRVAVRYEPAHGFVYLEVLGTV